ncbi:hypothetical protein [Burkholderia cepacia]|uniref:hypothetical protein n=1 Tax=Burkholderia cepacia TaxID=292 RepID=UPI00075587B7|nr:hypothetical protein [Burkholderia cepacia]KVH29610.1 hypothetical protein WS88_34715 [Burkholderia cepacia]
MLLILEIAAGIVLAVVVLGLVEERGSSLLVGLSMVIVGAIVLLISGLVLSGVENGNSQEICAVLGIIGAIALLFYGKSIAENPRSTRTMLGRAVIYFYAAIWYVSRVAILAVLAVATAGSVYQGVRTACVVIPIVGIIFYFVFLHAPLKARRLKRIDEQAH